MEELGYTQEQVAKNIGYSRSYIANTLRLLSLPQEVVDMIDMGTISAGHGKALIKAANPLELANKIINDSMSVRDAEDAVRNENEQQDVDPSLSQSQISQEDLRNKKLKSLRLRSMERELSHRIGNLKVKATYDNKSKKGKVTIFYDDLDQVKKIIETL